MGKEAILDFLIMNGELMPVENDKILELTQGAKVYEVIRLIEGVPLFLEDHINRMRKSVELLGYEMNKTDEEIASEISILMKANHCNYLNVKLVCGGFEKKKQDFFIFFIDSFYPPKEIYQKGIHTATLSIERDNPQVKIVNMDYKNKVKEIMDKQNAFEVLLVNHDYYITEGSRSNIFFVAAEKVYTAPNDDVLLGVTRNHIMDVCEGLNINVVERMVHINELKDMEGAFMTGTSVNVLPISSIDGYRYQSVNNVMIRRIMDGYYNIMKEYIAQRK